MIEHWKELEMIGVQFVSEFVQTVLLSGRVENESPVSTFLIAEPEHGKTSVCLESPFSCAVDVTDTTGKGLLEILKYKAEITHVIFNDLTIVSAHGRNVRNYLISIINAMTEEGVRTFAFPGQVENIPNGKRGIIACCTPSLISDGRVWFNKIGMTSRIIPFHYSYSDSLIVKIKMFISRDGKPDIPDALRIPESVIPVEIPESLAKEILIISDKKSKELGDPTGIRRLIQFRRLAKAHALLGKFPWKKNIEVTKHDIDFLKRIYPYIDYSKGCVL